MDKRGFTLLEMLFSLFIITIIVSFVSYNVILEVRTSQVTNASLQVSASLEAGRSCAMASREDASVKFSAEKIEVDCNKNTHVIEVPKVEITTNFPSDTAKFNSRGVVNRGATINVCNKSGCKRVTIGIGRSDVQIK